MDASGKPIDTLALTGSRIPTKRTDKMLFQVGSKDYQEMKAGLMAPLTPPKD